MLPATGGTPLTGVALDYLDMNLESFQNVSEPTISNLSNKAFSDFENVYAIIDADHPGMVDFSNPDALTDLVDEMYEHPVINSPLGVASSLSGIVGVVDVGRAALAMANLGGELADVAKDLPQAAQELSALIKGDKKAKIIKNALLFGSGRRANSLQTMLDQINEAEFGHIWKISKAINDTYLSGKHETAAKAFESVLYVLQKEVADEQAENLRNGIWAKITLQDFIVKKWVEENIINEATYNDFKNLNVYSKEKDKDYSLFWSTPVVRKLLRAYQSYDLMTDDDIAVSPEPLYDFETEVNNTSLNLYDIQIPESVLNDAEFGQPQSITYLYDGDDIFTSYPDAITNRTNIAGTEIPKSFILNLSAYPALKSSGEFNVTLDYGNDNRKYAADYLRFSPEIASVAVLSAPDQWASEDFSLDVEICGDETSFVDIFYKKAEDSGFPLFDYTSFRLADPTNIDGDCRTYSVTVDGWKLMYLLGGNRDVSLLLEAYGTSATVSDRQSGILTKYLVNLNDLDNDNLPDSWEDQYFEDRFIYSAADDPDGDGADNLFEYQHGTDPTKPGAEGVIESIIFQPIELSSGDWQYDFSLSGMYWKNVIQKNVTLTIYEDEAVVQGSFTLESGTLDLNGRILVIMGDFLHSGGTLNVNGGRLIIKGNYNIGRESSTDGKTDSAEGRLYMQNPDDYVLVEGDFSVDVCIQGSNTANFTNGILEVKGNFNQKATRPEARNCYYGFPERSFVAQNEHKVILSGEGQQNVNFASPTTSHFNKLEIQNQDILFTPSLVTNQLKSTVPIANLTLQHKGLVLEQDLAVEGDFRVAGNTLNLNGKTLTVNGSLLQTGGNVVMNNGNMLIEHNYIIGREGTIDGKTDSAEGRLYMQNPDDYVLVEGDFSVDVCIQGSNTANFTNGILEVKGNFTQKATRPEARNCYYGFPERSFAASGEHKVVLSGEEKQDIKFASPSGSYFNIIEINNNSSEMVSFSTTIIVFNHQRKPFFLANISQKNFVDYDSDGIKDHQDSYPLDPNQSNFDQDNDGVPDNLDAFPYDPTESVDSDNDSIGNNADTDDDNDGIADTKDAFPLDASEWADTDNDGQGDNADIDDDNDNITDEEDNCPLITNPDQEDENGYLDDDGIGDACEEQPKKSMICFPVKAKNGNVAIICL